jgi:CheY-like chemotaxis protein
LSYPREIRTLVIEDETAMVETYRRYFQQFLDQGLPVAPVTIAQSFKDAETELNRERVIHVVILDLRLPENAGGTSEETSARGLQLVSQIAAREQYPVPVLLIVTGDVRRASPLEQLQFQLEESFAYGRIVEKGIDLAADIRKGLDASLQYCEIGIHLTGKPEEMYPMVSAREEDLLRRCTLQEDDAIGLDLRWWAADRRDCGGGESLEWVKVLQGRFLLLGDAGVSRPRFFKFESIANGERSRAGAIRLAQKVNHIQVIRSLRGSDRHLLVTDKAGPSNSEPIALSAFLVDQKASVKANLTQVAADIADQLSELGDTTVEELSTRDLLWPFHNSERLIGACKENDLNGAGPAELLRQLQKADTKHWCNIRMRHGDLHIHNVSLDQDTGEVRAYLIDPGGMQRGLAERDFASLEVSLLLHQRYEATIAGSLVSGCRDLLDGSSPDGAASSASTLPQHHKSTRALVQELRLRALQQCKALTPTYAICLLDEVLIQLGGFAFGTSQNKIYCQADAMELFRYLRVWFDRWSRGEGSSSHI